MTDRDRETAALRQTRTSIPDLREGGICVHGRMIDCGDYGESPLDASSCEDCIAMVYAEMDRLSAALATARREERERCAKVLGIHILDMDAAIRALGGE